MNFRIIHFFALLLVIMAMPLSIPAGEVYMWIDDQGVRHITDQPPEKPAKMIGKESYKKDSPEEIRRHQLQQKLKQYEDDIETARQRQINQANEAAEKWRDRQREIAKERENRLKEETRRDIDDLNARKERQRINENETSDNYWRQYYKDQQRTIDREIKDKQKILDIQ